MKGKAFFLALTAFAFVAAWPCQAAETWRDAFDYADGSAGEPAWQADSVAWEVRNGRMAFDAGDKSFLVVQKLGHGRRVTIEATLVVGGRKGDGWCVAGLALRRDDPNHWHLALVDSPPGNQLGRFVELTESYGGRWLANYQGPTALRQTAAAGPDWRWEYNHPYRLRLTVSPQGIEGKVMELDGTLRRHLGWAFDEGIAAVKEGQAALVAGRLTGYFDDAHAEVEDMVPAPETQAVGKQLPAYHLPGCEQVKGKKTGFFHAEKEGDTWWLIDPNGLGFYAVGTDHIDYNAHWCQKLGYAPYNRFVSQKYGSEENWAKATVERLSSWGFNTVAAGHSQSLRHTRFAHTEWYAAGHTFADIADIVPRTTWTGFPNVFSPKWPRHCDALARRICAPNRDDPWLLGYFLDNELQWFGELTDWNNEFGLWSETWKKPAQHTAKQAWLKLAREHCPDIGAFNRVWGTDYASFDDLAASTQPRAAGTDEAKQMARQYARLVAELYFRESTEAIRRHDPNHMVLGCRFAGWAPGIWDIAGKYCDVVSFNSYPRIDVDRGVPLAIIEQYREFARQAQKPLMVTEWSFPALDSGLPCKHGAGMRVATQAQKARCFTFFQRMLFSLPFVVGSDYFMYIDEPALGISDTFPEDSNYGLVNERDEPWPELTSAAAALNPQACALHLVAKLDAVDESTTAPAWNRAVPRVATENPVLPITLRSGPLELTSATGEGDAWTMRYEGVPLGMWFPLIHQRVPGNLWTRPDGSQVAAVREDGDFVVVDMTFARKAGGEAITAFDAKAGRRTPQQDQPPGYAAGWRFWVPKRSCGWFGTQSLWVENTDARPWRLSGLFHYTRPAIGGTPEGDEEGKVNVPNFYAPVAAWEDRAVGFGQAVCAFGEGLNVYYWKGADGFHSDCFQVVDVELKAGQRYEGAGALAIHFGYPSRTDADLLVRLEQVRQEAMALAR